VLTLSAAADNSQIQKELFGAAKVGGIYYIAKSKDQYFNLILRFLMD